MTQTYTYLNEFGNIQNHDSAIYLISRSQRKNIKNKSAARYALKLDNEDYSLLICRNHWREYIQVYVGQGSSCTDFPAFGSKHQYVEDNTIYPICYPMYTVKSQPKVRDFYQEVFGNQGKQSTDFINFYHQGALLSEKYPYFISLRYLTNLLIFSVQSQELDLSIKMKECDVI